LFTERDHENPVRGVYRAHTQALSLAVQQRWLPCVIFEDNVQVTEQFDAEALRSALAYALEQQPSQILLSRFPFVHTCGFFSPTCLTESTGHPGVCELHPENVTGLSAWVATEESARLWPAWNNRHLDYEIAFAKWPLRLGIVPMPFARSRVKSTNVWTWGGGSDGVKFPPWLSGFITNNVQRFNRYSQHLDNAPAMLTLILVIALLVAWWVYRRATRKAK
jgi:hypothetical protein